MGILLELVEGKARSLDCVRLRLTSLEMTMEIGALGMTMK